MSQYVRRILSNLEIGSFELKLLVSEILPDNTLTLLSINVIKTKGIKNGEIYSLNLLSQCILELVSKVEYLLNMVIHSLNISISNNSIRCVNEIGMVSLLNKKVTVYDIENVINMAKNIKLLKNNFLLHVVPQEYIIDNYEGIRNPLGLSGMRLQVKVLLIICDSYFIKNLRKVIRLSNLNVSKLYFSGIVSGYSVLSNGEKESGVCLVDIGFNNINISLYCYGILLYTLIIPYAGDIITNDISYEFNIPYLESEYIKVHYSYLSNLKLQNNIIIKIPNMSNISNVLFYDISRNKLLEVVKLRYLEFFDLIKINLLFLEKKILKFHKNFFLNSGIVFIGGGSLIYGLLSFAKKKFKFNVRIGNCLENFKSMSYIAKDIDISSPIFATVVGMLFYLKQNLILDLFNNNKSNLNFFIRLINWLKRK